MDEDDIKSNAADGRGHNETSADSCNSINSSLIADKTDDRVTQQRHTLELTWRYADVQRAQIVSSAVDQEVGEIDDTRSRARVKRDDTTVTVRIAAADLIALRAGVNTWTRFVATAEEVLGSVDSSIHDTDR